MPQQCPGLRVTHDRLHAAAQHGKSGFRPFDFVAPVPERRDDRVRDPVLHHHAAAIEQPGAGRLDGLADVQPEVDVVDHGLGLGLHDAVAARGSDRERRLPVAGTDDG